MCRSSAIFFNDTATTEIYTYGHTLSLHDALPILVHAVTQNTELFRLLLCRLHNTFEVFRLRLMAVGVPFAQQFEVLRQPRSRVAERPGGRLVGRTIGIRVVRGLLPFGGMGEIFAQRRAVVCPDSGGARGGA